MIQARTTQHGAAHAYDPLDDFSGYTFKRKPKSHNARRGRTPLRTEKQYNQAAARAAKRGAA